MSKVTAKFQITIPKEVRKAMKIMPGVDVSFREEKGKFYLVKNTNIDPFDKWRGIFKMNKDVDDIMADLRGHALEIPV